MEITIRVVRFEEFANIIALYQELNSGDPPPDPSTAQAVWEEILADPKVHLFVALVGEGIVGTCILTIIPNLSAGARPYGLIENVVTKVEFRRQGVGAALLHYACGIAWEGRCYKVMLMTGSKREETLRFYRMNGFSEERTGFVARPR